MSDLPDIHIFIAAAQRGDLKAFEAIVRHFQAPVRAWVAVHCPPGGDVDEVAQRTFIAAFERLEEFSPGTHFAAWLFTIARFQLRTETTRLRRVADYHSRYAGDLLEAELDRRAQGGEETSHERLRFLRACLDELGNTCRQFIHWRYDEEIPLAEMAARTGRTVAAVKKQLWLIREKLHRCVEGKLAETGGQ